MNRALLAALAPSLAALCLAATTAQAAPPLRPTDVRIGKPIPTPNLAPLPEALRLPYDFAPSPVAPNGQKFANIGAVAVLPGTGNLLVFNRNAAIQMVEYTPDLKVVRIFNPNIAVNAHGLRIDRHGNIWAIDSFLNVIWKLNAKGEPLRMFGKRGEVGAWPESGTDGAWNGMFNQPLDVAFDAQDNFYVVQGHAGTSNPEACTYCATYDTTIPSVTQGSDARVMKFDKDGKFLASLAVPHPAPELYPFIHSVVVTPAGEVWVTDRQLNKIIVLDQSLKRLREIPVPALTSGLYVDAKGTTWVATGMDGLVLKLDAAGKVIGWMGKAGRTFEPDAPVIGEGHYLAVSPDQKTIYVADSANARVVVLKAR